MAKFCIKCGKALNEGAMFCQACGAQIGAAYENSEAQLSEEYSYETHEKLFPWKVVIPIVLLLWLPMTGIGLLVAITEGFWFVPVIMSAIVLLGVFIVAWGYKGKQEKWGVWRTLWIISPQGVASGYPPEVAKRLTAIGAASAPINLAARHNWGVISHGLNELDNLGTIIAGLPVCPWQAFTTATYHPEKREIDLHLPAGKCIKVETNPDNYATVEQLVRRYMGGR